MRVSGRWWTRWARRIRCGERRGSMVNWQTRHRRIGANDLAAPAATRSSAVTDLANLSRESRGVPGVPGLLHRADAHRTRAVRACPARPPPPPDRPPDGHRTSHGRMDGATDHRSLSGRHRTEMAVAGSRCDLWRRVPAPGRRHGHRGSRLESVKSLAESVCRAPDRIHLSRVPGSRHRPEPSASAPRARPISLLLSWGANASLAGERRALATPRASPDGR